MDSEMDTEKFSERDKTVIDNEKYRDRERNTQKERVVSIYVRS